MTARVGRVAPVLDAGAGVLKADLRDCDG